MFNSSLKIKGTSVFVMPFGVCKQSRSASGLLQLIAEEGVHELGIAAEATNLDDALVHPVDCEALRPLYPRLRCQNPHPASLFQGGHRMRSSALVSFGYSYT